MSSNSSKGSVPGGTTLRYLTGFGCIAERCEDTCCRGLTIPLTGADVERLEGAGAAAEAVELRADGSPTLRKRADGGCVLLTGPGRCGLQERAGEGALPGICASFPRVQAGRVRLGTVACPEVARLALLADDAMELLGADGAPVDPAEVGGWRGRVAALLTAAEVPLGPALWAAGAIAEALARGELARAEAVEAQARTPAWAAAFEALSLPVEPVFAVVLQLFSAAIAAAGPGRLRARVWPVFDRCERLTVPIDVFWSGASAGLDRPTRALLDRGLRNLALNGLWRAGEGGVSGAPTLRELLVLAVRGAVCKVLFLGAEPGESGTPAQRLVSGAQVLARHLEPSPAWTTLIDRLGAGPPERVLSHLLLFAKL